MRKTTKSKQIREKISNSLKKFYTENKPPQKGLKRSLETIEKIKKARASQVFTAETRKKMSLAHKGEKCHWWRGGKEKDRAERHNIMSNIDYKLWREAVFKRDNYTCIWCGDNRGNNLQADHIQLWKDRPDLRFAIDNGRTLCKSCHIKRHKYAGFSIQGHNSNTEDIQPKETN